MMTVHKFGVAVGDRWAAVRRARYSLDRSESPDAFARGGDDTADEAGVERASAVWLGTQEALGRLGLVRGAEVTEEQLSLALQGLHAVEGHRVRRPGTKQVPSGEVGPDGKPVMVSRKVVNSVDLTFSAPKSVSVVWSQAGPALRRGIEQAMIDAANAGLEHMIETKPVIQGQGVVASGFAASASLQVMARRAQGDVVPAPQLHVHGIVVGVDDGTRLRTPDPAALFKDDAPLEGGAVFRARLAERLAELGFEIRACTGRGSRFFEIAGVPDGLVDRMSPRAREVRRMIAQIEERTGERLAGRELGAVALLSRTAKTKGLTPQEIARVWDAQAQDFRFDERTVEALRDPGRSRQPLRQVREQARATILAQIWERGPTVSAGEAVAIAFQVAPLGLTLEQASELLEEMQRTGELIALENRRVTAREIRTLEEKVIRTARAAASGGVALSSAAVERGIGAANRSLGEGKELDPEQLRAIGTLTSGAGWATLTGRAGTGKGPVLQAVAEAHRAAGWQVIAGAVDGATAQRLGHQIEASALTLEQIMYRTSQEGQSAIRVDNRTLILIEEASKVGLVQWSQIADLVRRHDVRVLAVGHTGQLGAIELPGMYEQMIVRKKVIPTAELTEIRRHRDPADPRRPHPWLAKYQVMLDTGDGKGALAELREHDALTIHETRADAIVGMVDQWDTRRRLYDDPREAIMVVHGSNDDVDLVNKLAQQHRRATRDLGDQSVQAVDRDYRIYPGDVVMLRESAYQFERGPSGERPRRIENGTIGIVDSVDPYEDQLRVMLNEPGAQPRLVVIDQRRLRRELTTGGERVAAPRLAYAFHVYPVQGGTFKDVGVLEGHHTQNKESTYTADTRAQLHLHKHADRESLGIEGSDEDRDKRYIKKITTSGARLASISQEVSNDPVIAALAIGQPAPELPLRGGAEPSRESATASPEAFADPLAPYRTILGEQRTRRLERHADKLREQLADRGLQWLHDRRRELGDPFAAFNDLEVRAAALETLRLERDARILRSSIENALKTAEALEDQAREHRGFRSQTRRDLLEAAAIERGHAQVGLDDLGELHDTEQDLHQRGRHLDDWWTAHAQNAAKQLALDQELTARHRREHELELEHGADSAVAYEGETMTAEPGLETELDPGPQPPELEL
jgi:conjugative relaxase-like TrwC/TraI family protein